MLSECRLVVSSEWGIPPSGVVGRGGCVAVCENETEITGLTSDCWNQLFRTVSRMLRFETRCSNSVSCLRIVFFDIRVCDMKSDVWESNHVVWASSHVVCENQTSKRRNACSHGNGWAEWVHAHARTLFLITRARRRPSRVYCRPQANCQTT